ncbi:hypothetical protein SAMN05720766_1103 [Fibrobacter sp. UWH9]|uniref:hypothetical protein n=1 Tax=unclassified Fibrobacter TaxID=2634177 RepID=UPI0009131403|nr:MULTISPECIES: hypothetical protein [Fibrobacter]MCL4102997.1 hypothetical protein [Fibrobacter succinogenes]MCQ2100055.1 hypothetical protein [Fibrobacter sp.]MDO4948500.1 hypothetical protein [Fibrobacter sp.]SHH30548.1 hypothetical protein SAMN05720766_1103 [Fibrobacter sp. UWH9]
MKKEYVAPKMDVLEVCVNAALLQGSGTEGGPDATEYDGEFGFDYNPEMNKKA